MGSRKLVSAIAVVCGAVLFNAVVAYYNMNRLAASQEWVTHTVQVRQALRDLELALVSAETSERGFALTGNVVVLSEHSAALSAMRTAAATVRTLTADNHAQQRMLDQIQSHIREATTWYSRVITVAQYSGLNAAQALVTDGPGTKLTAIVRSELQQMDSAENALLRQRTEDAALNLRVAIGSFMALTLVAILLAAYLGRAIRRELRERDQSQAAAFNTNQMLRCVLDTIPQRVFWKDRASRYLGANRLFAQDCGHESA
jgi:CHASE3 domain sensor protein